MFTFYIWRIYLNVKSSLHVTNLNNVAFEVLTEVVVNVAFLWDIAPCGPYMNHCFGRTYYLRCFSVRKRTIATERRRWSANLSSWGWVDPVPDPLLRTKSCSAGNRTREVWICRQAVHLQPQGRKSTEQEQRCASRAATAVMTQPQIKAERHCALCQCCRDGS
jgi:hypothetical protein